MKKKNARLICAGGMFDHVHLYASLPSTISIADFVIGMDLARSFGPHGFDSGLVRKVIITLDRDHETWKDGEPAKRMSA